MNNLTLKEEKELFNRWAKQNTGELKIFSPPAPTADSATFYFLIWQGGFHSEQSNPSGL